MCVYVAEGQGEEFESGWSILITHTGFRANLLTDQRIHFIFDT